MTQENKYLVYVGTYTKKEGHLANKEQYGKGIYAFYYHSNTRRLLPVGSTDSFSNTSLVAILENPTYLCFHPSKEILYAVSEVTEGTNSLIHSFSIHDTTLQHINTKPAKGGSACYVTIDSSGSFLYVANYRTCTSIVYHVNPDGSLGDMIQFLTHQGSGPNKSRQDCAHPHHIALVHPTIVPSTASTTKIMRERYAFICDLGIDAVVQYKVNLETGELLLNEDSYFKTGPGSGPRHLVFDHQQRYAYIVNELECTVISARLDPGTGTLREVQRVSTLPAGYTELNRCGAIRLSPNGKFLLASNRGHDSVALFLVGEEGHLTAIGHHSSGGHTPRDFNFDPSGSLVIITNQDSDTIKICSIQEKETGYCLKDEGTLTAPTPVNLLFRIL